ncbi:acetyl/propionyl/methylcrotonyl-CoA carboxylase subunit alpha [Yoonia sediminilitoris]|uniref:3-methylcrotonyl-CoA carboxylase alpha subunit n=1 Tax=Yoonia sediminilitoris TaxID=1286148 RepID=A0A2T6KR74_9RHOB|nr:acetyl/propionyl/methylcrotonyl-CoA carboxylase subunit alpha [Yoonia sediminilitoris]PUB19061.1 3-methylcrotonyl-CoA carboxylase alpha subunit [Yoonia sediminilitoris]RCW99229.1 3-methylcrotonyl-CoA carboxylase alpha subunit [Yoonia sediminilitoris]
MFDKILIANRGEIACRIIKTARAMGVRTVAVYSDADAQALHVAQADEVVRLGPAPVADSYLRGDLIVQAARDTGAQAIHPGYGFLSENPEFVDLVTDAGLVFIGPSAKAIRAMGLKDAAKALMADAGVPVVQGYHGSQQDPAFLAKKAAEIGYPVLIKAVAGGGGKGMRLVEGAPDFLENLASAQSEARSAFGNADVLIEKYITSPRHIEVQVFGDGVDAVHLFERDCSLQRRHQKVIEEAPAPGMTDAVRQAMGDAAVTAAKAIGYAGAGTIEFIVDGSNGLRTDGFWFMEMNTRLQVEHPVTEAITGVDLVEWQLRVAAGEPLPLSQADLTISGHAFEARLYAEDVPAGFLPATGRLDHLQFPENARIDTGVMTGDEISPWYDPMIAKITTHGPDRPTALRRLHAALDATQVAGTVTNLGFLRRLARYRGFNDGDVDTGLITRNSDSLCRTPMPDNRTVAVAAVEAARIAPGALTGFSLWAPLCHDIMLAQGDDIHCVRLTFQGPDTVLAAIAGDQLMLRRTADHWGVPALRHGAQVTVFGAETHSFDLIDPLERASDAQGGDSVMSPMPGLVRAVSVAMGQVVSAGERLVVLEAMKMEHVLCAPRDGTVASVAVAAGDQVTAGMMLVALEDAT